MDDHFENPDWMAGYVQGMKDMRLICAAELAGYVARVVDLEARADALERDVAGTGSVSLAALPSLGRLPDPIAGSVPGTSGPCPSCACEVGSSYTCRNCTAFRSMMS